MIPPTRIARQMTLLICSWALPMLGGCSQLIASGLGIGAEGPPNRGIPATGPRPLSMAGTRRVTGPTSVYQHGPTMDWSNLTVAPPRSVSMSLFEYTHPSYRCQVIPEGMNLVSSPPNGSAGQTVAEFGPIEVGIAGYPISLETLSAFDEERFYQQSLMASAGRGTSGSQACAYRAFLFLRLNVLGVRQDPVVVAR